MNVLEDITPGGLNAAWRDGFLSMLQKRCHEISRSKGWWDGPQNDGEKIALMHSELSEALEALRVGNPADDHIPEFSGAEAELADVVIRILDLAEARGWRIGAAVLAKVRYNEGRPHKHGGKAF